MSEEKEKYISRFNMTPARDRFEGEYVVTRIELTDEEKKALDLYDELLERDLDNTPMTTEERVTMALAKQVYKSLKQHQEAISEISQTEGHLNVLKSQASESRELAGGFAKKVLKDR